MPHHFHLFLLLTFLCASLCHSVSVSTADGLINLFKSVTESILKTDIKLTADLDFSGSSLTLPLGAFSNGTCVAYSGAFQGNGHSIYGLRMINNGDKNGAGLFCSLKNATIENLVIGSSCSFAGNYAGALSVSIGGSLAVTNTINRAMVQGAYGAGGFIGYVIDLKQTTVILFEGCVNHGFISGQFSGFGGFLGLIDGSNNMTITISHSTNIGDVTGVGNHAGGFVGSILVTQIWL